MTSWYGRRIFQKHRFHNTYIEKPTFKVWKKIDLLQELPFYDELVIYEMSKAFGWYEKNYKVELIESKDPLSQLEASK